VSRHLRRKPGKPSQASKSEDRTATASLPLPTPGAALSSPLTLEPPARPSCPRCGTQYLSKRNTCSICDAPAPDEARPGPGELTSTSSIREKAIKIYVLHHAAGMSYEEIGKLMNLSPKTLPGYVYKAGKMGWLQEYIHDPKEQLELVLAHKVIRNLNESLDDDVRNEKTGIPVKTHVALQMAEGMFFKKGPDTTEGAPSTVIGVKVEIVGGTPGQIREGTTGGTPAYIDAEVVTHEGD
jgi:hypothetical protein